MGEESEIINSLGNYTVPTTLPDNYDDHLDDFEAWEPLIEFHEKEDYAGLVSDEGEYRSENMLHR